MNHLRLGLLLSAFALGSPARGQKPDAKTLAIELEKGSRKTYEANLRHAENVTVPAIPDSFREDERPGAMRSIRFKQTRTYEGKVEVEGRKLDAFTIRNGTKLLRTEYSRIDATGVYAAGQKNADGSGFLFPEPVPVLKKDSRAGDQWVVHGKKPETGEKYVLQEIRILGKETIRVPAGEFACMRVRLEDPRNGGASQRDLWIHPRTGVVRDRTYRFLGNKMILMEDYQLLRIEATAGAAEQKAGN